MFSFDYTVDLQLEDTLSSVDRIRSHILTLALPPATELKLQWEGMAIRSWATLALTDRDVPKHYVATILAHPTKPTRATAEIFAIRDAFSHIHSSWRANPKPVSLSALQTIYTMLSPQAATPFSALEKSLSELLGYISAETAHPVVQASIAHIYILTIPDTTDIGLFARMVHYLLLSKYGYDLRGYATPERVWQEDASTYTRLQGAYTATHHMTGWLEFMAESMRRTLETLSSDIESTRFHIEFPQSFWQMNDRQKDLMKLLDAPSATITNKKVQKRFRVSQITASRDLARLTSLGLLYPHGKGRSIYYTKI